VDTYVERVNRLIAELEVGRSPQSAVRHALDRVGEQTSGILQRAREAAEQITGSARQEAEETTARARAEGAEIIANAIAEADDMVSRARAEAESTVARARAEAAEHRERSEQELTTLREAAERRMRELRADTDAIWEERRKLLDELRRMAARVEEVANEFPRRLTEEEGPREAEAASQTAVTAVGAAAEHGGTQTEPSAGRTDAPADEEPEAAARRHEG
jgi:cell division septum initiation protein DivIVA